MAYADAGDCRATKGFPTDAQISDEQVDEWCEDVSGELDLVFVKAGVAPASLPVEGPPALLSHLKNAVVWGVASRMESAPLMAQPGQVAAGMNVYQQEYIRLKRELESLTREQLILVGLISGLSPVTAAGFVGLGLAGNDYVDDRYAPSGARLPSWLNGPWVEYQPGQG
jgi:hypothetical protein